MKSLNEIREVADEAEEIARPHDIPGYTAGVRDALRWVVGDPQDETTSLDYILGQVAETRRTRESLAVAVPERARMERRFILLDLDFLPDLPPVDSGTFLPSYRFLAVDGRTLEAYTRAVEEL